MGRAIVTVLLLLATSSVVAAPAPLPRRQKHDQSDHAALQGEWKAVLYDGEDPAIYWGGFKLIVRSNRATGHTAGGECGLDGVFS